jgi:TM2 domain-containing membrane protein YozV
MENRNKFLTFILACIPGVGQIYLGLFKKGIQLLALFFLIEPILSFIGIHYFSEILQILIWCYAFFDTFEIAKRLDRGQVVQDTDYIFAKYTNQGNGPQANANANANTNANANANGTQTNGFQTYGSQTNGVPNFNAKNLYDNKKFWIVCGWGLIIIGIMAITNLAFGTYDLYELIKSYISTYIVPVGLVAAGVYMLTKKNKQN